MQTIATHIVIRQYFKVWIISGLFVISESLYTELNFSRGERFMWIGSLHAHRIKSIPNVTHISIWLKWQPWKFGWCLTFQIEMTARSHINRWESRIQLFRRDLKSLERCDSLTRMPEIHRLRDREDEIKTELQHWTRKNIRTKNKEET